MKPLMKTDMSPKPHTDSSQAQPASGLPSGMDALAHEIARVERRLVARELGLQQRVEAIRHTARSAMRPRRSMVPWAGALMVLWPLLPRFLRPRLSPASAITVFSMGLPTVKRLLTSHPAGPATVPDLDLARYMGQWNEVACLSHRHAAPDLGQATTHFAMVNAVGDEPSITVRHHVPAPGGRMRESRGVARIVPGSGAARWKESFLPSWARWWPGAWDDHWVLHVDADYTEAVVGDAGRRRLRVLSRYPAMEPARLQALLDLAQAQGYDVARMSLSAAHAR